MARQAEIAESKANVVTRVYDFYLEVKSEMSKVTWPSKEELKASTSVVLFLLAIFAVVIYFFDIVFQNAVFTIFRLV